jgi:hypothetical protein
MASYRGSFALIYIINFSISKRIYLLLHPLCVMATEFAVVYRKTSHFVRKLVAKGNVSTGIHLASGLRGPCTFLASHLATDLEYFVSHFSTSCLQQTAIFHRDK